MRWMIPAVVLCLVCSGFACLSAEKECQSSEGMEGAETRVLSSPTPTPEANQWTNMFSWPSARNSHAMAYDVESDRVILFGGNRETGRNDETWAYDFDSNTWMNMNPATKPPARNGHAMAYDVESDCVILFGGYGGTGYSDETWAYYFNNNTWMNMNPATKPSARSYHAMAYDVESDCVILFGGYVGTGHSDETWAYYFNNNTWMNMNPAAKPPALSGHAMAYDAESDCSILFGGNGRTGYSDETWAYYFNNNTWVNMAPATKPSARNGHAMAYDAESDWVILFGGAISERTDETWAYDSDKDEWINMRPETKPSARCYAAMVYDNKSDRTILFSGGGAYTDAIWAYDLEDKAWTSMTPSLGPSSRDSHAMAYDAKSDRTILFGGYDGATRSNETWAYDFNTNKWINMTSPTGPSARYQHAMAYDAESDRVILFGGYDGTSCSDETWAYDFDSNKWTNMTSMISPTRPSAREYHAMAYDADSDRVILFGGYDWNEKRDSNETWAYDFNFNEWTNVTSPTGPSAREAHAMAYDAEFDRVILFGGYVWDDDDDCQETWAYDFDYNTWTETTQATTPSARDGHAMAYDSQSDRVILFGGYASGYSGETWTYDFEGNEWTNLTFSTSPSPRMGHAMAYDERSDRVILFGGYGGTGYSDETWAYDFDNNTWMNMNPATKPPARNGHAMAYDVESDCVILFGGYGGTGYSDETWAYYFNNNTWMNMNPATKPSARYSHAMAYDAKSDRVILFGGWCGTDCSDETWAYNSNNNTWENMNPSTKPSARYGHAMAYDAKSDRMILFGGGHGGGILDDETWVYDFNINRWTIVNPVTKPSGRVSHTMVYGATSDRIFLFGGFDGSLSDETWYYDFDSDEWAYMTPSMKPSARNGHAMVYDAQSERIILFGGYDEDYDDETWAYRALAGPSAPEEVRVSAGDRQAVLTWKPPSSDGGLQVSAYRIYQGTSSGSLSRLVELSGVLTYTSGGLTNGVTYYYQVSAVNSFDEGARSAEVQVTPGALPSEPKNLLATAGTKQVTLTWEAPSSTGGLSLTGYSVYRGTSPGGESLLVRLGVVLTYTDTGLTAGMTYYYRVTANNSMGEGPRSNEAYAEPTAEEPVAPLVVGIDADPKSGSPPLEVSFSCSVTGGVGPYSYLWNFDDGNTSTLQNPKHTYESAGEYQVKVNVTDAAGNSTEKSIEIKVGVSGGTEWLTIAAAGIVAAVAVAVAVMLLMRRKGKTAPVAPDEQGQEPPPPTT